MFKIKTLAALLIVALLTSFTTVANAEEIQPLQTYNTTEKIIPSEPKTVNNYDVKLVSDKNVEIASIPTAPSNLSLVHATSTFALIDWYAPTDNGGETITGYKVGISEDDISYQYFTVTDEYILVEGFTQNKTYWITVQAQNASGYSDSTSGTFVTPTTDSVPTEPLLVMTGTITDTSINMSWNIPQKSGTSLTNYILAYSKDNSTWTEVTVPYGFMSRETYNLTGLEKGTDYYLKVAAVNSTGQGAWSSVLTAKTSGTPSTISADPTNLGVTSFNQSSVTLAWYAPASNGGEQIIDYVVQYKSNASTTWITFNDGISTSTGATVNNLLGGTKYNFRVAAVNKIGTSGYTLPITQLTAAKTAPDAPTNLKIVDGYKTSFQISWAAPVNNGGSAIKDYIVQYKLNTSTTWTTFNDGISTSTKALITGVLNNKTYNYRIAAVNNIGQSVYSATNYLVMSPPAMPLTASIQQVTDDSVTIALSHVYNSFKPILRDTIVQYRKTGTTTWLVYPDGSGVSNTVTISGLTSSTAYEFRVSSANTSGWGAFSSIMSATTKTPIVSDPPTNLTGVLASKNNILVTWSESPSVNIADYVVEYSTDGNNWNTYNDGTSISPVALLTGLSLNTQYKIRIATIVSGVKSAYSSPVTVSTSTGTTTPLAPAGLDVISVSSNSASITWNQVESLDSKITGYQVGISTDGINYMYSLGSASAGNASITSMTANTKYWVSVQAVNVNGLGLPIVTTLTTST